MMKIRGLSVDDYMEKCKAFHGHLAPGMVCGGFMVELAYQNLPDPGLYDAIAETRACLPDAVQLLTPCTIGNGWLKIVDTGRFALALYDKHTGAGVRVALDLQRLEDWPETHAWAMKLKAKKEQDKEKLYGEIILAGFGLYKVEGIQIDLSRLAKKGKIYTCTSCNESFRGSAAGECDACKGNVPFSLSGEIAIQVSAIPVEAAAGKTLLHDMTRIIAGISKAPALLKGETLSEGDIDLLKSMGKEQIYVAENRLPSPEQIHENDAALLFAEKMAGPGICFDPRPREGKIDFVAARDGVFCVEKDTLTRFNRCHDVMCASRCEYIPVKKGMILAGTRAIPLYISKIALESAMMCLDDGPIFSVAPYRLKKMGILVTGTEVAKGRVKDAFIPIMAACAETYALDLAGKAICPDDRGKIAAAANDLISSGAEILVLTGGLSVDPDDVTRAALRDAGLMDEIYGMPVLPGAMTLIGRIAKTRVIGVPAGALYFSRTAFDLLLPRLLADLPITRSDIADLAEGGFLDAARRISD